MTWQHWFREALGVRRVLASLLHCTRWQHVPKQCEDAAHSKSTPRKQTN
jgi:hypothetical protein